MSGPQVASNNITDDSSQDNYNSFKKTSHHHFRQKHRHGLEDIKQHTETEITNNSDGNLKKS